jgi:lysophospholipase L1-like esterase
VGFSTPTPTSAGAPVRYVAVGDSYTIGTGVRTRERWPNQLVRALQPEVDLELVDNLATNGATSRDVIDDQLPQLADLDPEFLTLLVGVNDVVRRVRPAVYEANLSRILDAMLAVVPADRLLMVTTPDYTLTPHGADYGDPAQQRDAIAALNAIAVDVAAERGIAIVDIAPVADRVTQDPSLLASDELRPSAKQYAGWVELIAPTVRALFAPGTGRPGDDPGPSAGPSPSG